jgi:cytoskeletal protein RodZ
LEEEDFDQIGAEVFIKGHLRNYARLLDLPIEKILSALSDDTNLKGQVVLTPIITDHLVALKIIAYASLLLFLTTIVGIYISHN